MFVALFFPCKTKRKFLDKIKYSEIKVYMAHQFTNGFGKDDFLVSSALFSFAYIVWS